MSIDTPDTPEAPVQDTGVRTDILSGLQAKREKIGAASKPLDLDVPGYDGELVLRFQWVPFKQLARTGAQLAKIKEPTAQTVAAAADALVATCSEILVRVDGELEPLSTNDVPVTFSEGERVSVALGFTKADDARTTVLRTFSNEYALIKVANAVTTWLEDTSKAVDEEFVGE